MCLWPTPRVWLWVDGLSGLGLVWDSMLKQAPSAAPGSLASLCYQVLEKLCVFTGQNLGEVDTEVELQELRFLLRERVGATVVLGFLPH